MYNALESYLASFQQGKRVLLVSEGTEPAIRRMFPPDTQFTATSYPPVDVANLAEFHDGQFECAVTDQVLEHVRHPWRALSELRRVLVPGGIAINTSCSFNPIHDAGDYYRYMPDGFRALHEDFLGTVLLSGYWGNRQAIGDFVVNGKKSFDVRTSETDRVLASRTDRDWPWVVWCVARTPGGIQEQ